MLETAAGAITVADLDEGAGAWAAMLGSRGVGPGAAVVVHGDDPRWILPALLGVWAAGAAAVPLDRSRPEPEVARAVRESRAATVISEIPLARIPGVTHLPTAAPSRRGRTALRCRPGDPALLLFTSGTTGRPKCVVFSHRAMVRNVLAMAGAASLSEDDVVCTPMAPALPAVLATCLLPAVATGALVVFPGRFIPARTLRVIRERRATVLFAVPYLYDLLYESPASDMRSLAALRLCLTSSAALRPDLCAAYLDRFGLPIRSCYCSSEAGSVTVNAAEDRDHLLRSVGRPLPDVQVEVRDARGGAARPGEEGEIVVAGPLTAAGYWHRPVLERRVFRDGWVHTGDLGRLDADGYLSLVGRLSETFKVGGSLVNPIEVEEVLRRHPAVQDALVRPEPDPDAGAIPVALVVLRAPSDLRELRTHCAAHLSAAKVPRRVEFVAAIPRGRLGKPLRQPRDAS